MPEAAKTEAAGNAVVPAGAAPSEVPKPAAEFQPYIPAERTDVAEFTPKAIIIGVVFGIIFGAATVYLALKAGLTVSASIPIAMNAAFIPTTPPPMTMTVAAGTPGTPPSRTPRPPSGRSSMNAPACVAILPATSLIGARSGSWPPLSSTVS